MTKINFKKISTKKIAITLPVLISAIAILLITNNAISLQNNNDVSTKQSLIQYVGGQPGAVQRPLAPIPFSISVNGQTTPTTIASVQRGGTVQTDVDVTPLMSGILGTVTVQTAQPECGQSVSPKIQCVPKGLTMSLSESSVSSEKHLILTITAAKDMPAGTYPIEINADTTMNIPTQTAPVHTGYLAVFSVGVT